MEKERRIGIVRNTDDLGRIAIPKEIRKLLDIKIGDAVDFYIEKEILILKKYNPGCIFCGSVENTIYFMKKLVCKECAKEIK